MWPSTSEYTRINYDTNTNTITNIDIDIDIMATNKDKTPSKITTSQTSQEEKNIAVVKEYMSIAYSPTENKGRDSVAHLCTEDSWFHAPTTFPKCKDFPLISSHLIRRHRRRFFALYPLLLDCLSAMLASEAVHGPQGHDIYQRKTKINTHVFIPDLGKTPLDYADSHAEVMSSVSDLKITSYDIVFAKDGHVLLKYSAEGSHCGKPHNGIEATGNKAKWEAAAIFEVRDGKVHSFTKQWDKLNMFKQLGWMDGSEYV